MIFNCPHCNVRVEKHQRTCLTCSRVMVRLCPSCAEDVSTTAPICKYCGENLPAVLEQALKPVAIKAPTPVKIQAPAPEIEFLTETQHVRWEDRASGGVFSRWWSTWWASIFDPAAFWKKMPTDTGTLKPITFAWFQVAQLLIFALPLFIVCGAAHACDGHDITPLHVGLTYLALYPLSFLAVAIGTYATAAVWHLPLKLLGAKGTYANTVRIFAYNSSVGILSVLPVLGTMLGAMMNIFMNFYAFRSVHQMGRKRAVVAAFLPVIVTIGVLALMIGHHLANQWANC